MIYYKSLTLNNKSWYDDMTEWILGITMPEIDSHKNGPCGPGYHLAKSIEHAVGYGKFPCLLYEAEPCGNLLGEDDSKVRFTSARLIREISKPVWVRHIEEFLNSIKLVKWLDRHGKIDRSWKMFETRDAARDAARAAARDAGAGDATSAAAWDATWVAARTAAWAATGDATSAAAWVATSAAIWAAARAAAWDAARTAAWAAAWDAASAAAWDAARAAVLMARMEICCDLEIPQKHRSYVCRRWNVWESGYGLFCDINGVLYCYMKIA